MARDSTDVLEEIATLLRQYVEHTMEMSKRMQKRLAKVTPPRIDFTRNIEAMERKTAAAARRHSAEERAFRERLLSLLETHNKMLEQVIRAQAKDGKARAKKKAR
jgi:hypothetical protein